jgi:hypothetical protein
MARHEAIMDYIEAGLTALHRRIDDLLRAAQRTQDQASEAIEKRLDEQARDRDRIREAQGQFVTRTEFDLMAGRVATLERALARVYGALAVIVFLAGGIGLLVKYLH